MPGVRRTTFLVVGSTSRPGVTETRRAHPRKVLVDDVESTPQAGSADLTYSPTRRAAGRTTDDGGRGSREDYGHARVTVPTGAPNRPGP